ncbi:hypothetical protein HDV00_003291 [Rhizophlyctis rosea]|nr:hypothetical protein HDV00_003291 [Rhizophlyctis rosea]
MEESGFRGGGGGHDSHSPSFPSHDSSPSHHFPSDHSHFPRHHNHSHGSMFPSILPGVILGAAGTAALLGGRRQPTYNAVPVPPGAPRQPVRIPRPRRPRRVWSVVKIVTAVVAVVFLIVVAVTAVNVPRPGKEGVTLVVGDRKVITYQPYWFSSLKVSGSDDVDAYLFDTMPHLSERLNLPDKTVYPSLSKGSYHSVRYDLHQGSRVRVNWSFAKYTQSPTLTILRSTQAFEAWKSGIDPSSSYLIHQQQTPSGSYTFHLPESDSYYFIFWADPRVDASGSATFSIQSVTYSLSNPPPKWRCGQDDKGACEVELDRGWSKAFLMLVAPMAGDSWRVEVETKGRRGSYVIVGVGVGMLVGVGVGVVGCVWWWGGCFGRVWSGWGGYAPVGDEESGGEGGAGRERRSVARGAGRSTGREESTGTGTEESTGTGTEGTPVPPYNPDFGDGAVQGGPPSTPSGERRGEGSQEPSAPPPYSVLDPNDL